MASEYILRFLLLFSHRVRVAIINRGCWQTERALPPQQQAGVLLVVVIGVYVAHGGDLAFVELLLLVEIDFMRPLMEQ